MVFTKAQEIDIQNITKSSIKECFADKDFVDMFASKFAEFITKNLEQKIIDLTSKCNNLEKVVLNLQSDNKNLCNKIEILEQQQRSSAVRIYGVPENRSGNNEDLINLVMETVCQKFHEIQLKPDCIQTAYRVGKNTNSKSPRPIYLKFYSAYYTSAILRNRKVLKGSKIFISEDLTKTKYELFSLAKEKLGRANVWSRQGKIYVKNDRGKNIINTIEDLEKLLK